MLTTADVVVVGGGAIGSAVAYYLSRAGATVVVLERNALGSGSSSANPGSVSMVTKSPGRVTAVRTDRGPIRTTWLVNAAGAYSPPIGEMVGVKHDVVPRRGQIMVLEAVPDLPVSKMSTAKQLVAKHLTKPGSPEDNLSLACGYTPKPRSGTVLLGSTNEFVGLDTRNSLDAISGIRNYACRIMPG